MIFHLSLGFAYNNLLEIVALYYGIYESHFLGLCADFKVQHVDQMLSFAMYNEHETSCGLYLGDGNLKILSLHGMCMTINKIVPSIYDICMTGKCSPMSDKNCICSPTSDENCICSPTWDEICICSSSWDEICICSPSWDENCTCPPTWDENCIRSPTWDEAYMKWNETCECSHGKTCMIYCGSDILNFFLSLCDICETYEYFRRWNITSCKVYYEKEIFKFILTPNCTSGNRCQERYKFWKFRYKKPFYQYIHNLLSCSMFITISKCDVLRCSFYRTLMRKHDYKVYWLERYLKYISASIMYGYCIFTEKRKRGRLKKKEKDRKHPSVSNDDIERKNYFKSYFCAGGRHQTAIAGEIVCEYLQTCTDTKLLNNSQHFKGKSFHFEGYELLSDTSNESSVPLYFSKIPLEILTNYLNMKELQHMSDIHDIPMPINIEKKTMLTYFRNHHCTQCDLYVCVLTEKIKIKRNRTRKQKKIKTEILDIHHKYPPDPPSNELVQSIIQGFCNDTTPQNFEERGCAVCGRLSPINNMVLLTDLDFDSKLISPGDVGRYERLHESDPVMALGGAILAEDCYHVCQTCQCFLKRSKMPPESLANNFWIGSIPSVLQNLTFAEKMLISRIRHNKCLVRVSSGRAKMTANVIMFSNPTVKVYHALPPSRHEISEVLAFVFQGPIQPTDLDIKQTPMLVRRNVVKDALEWLKLNHVDYKDLYISIENLNDYPLAGVPVNIEYSKSDPDSGNKFTSAMSIYDDEFEEGTTDGPCPFTVHGLTGPEYKNMSIDRLKARVLQHLVDKGSTLGVSHDSKPQSMYDNPQVYPQMFPWLFPYGLGGIGQKCHFSKISESTQKLNLLMYHDKRFQTDFYFPMIAFNHEQLKAGVTGSFLLTKRKKWPDISNRLKSLNHEVLKNISDKLSNGGKFSPTTTEEKKCFQLLNDLDHVGGFVKGSITSKKHMRNEIWSMISQLGAPSWFITLSPADNRHPICLYYADKNIKFKPELRSSNERNLLVAQNPVAASRFFDLMVRMFIKHVLGIGTDHPGLYGNTAGYYGTVEQQGRLTLHLHTILWIKDALSPQEIRSRLMNNDGEFQQKLVQYLEGCQKGEFLTGPMEYVKSKIPIDIVNRSDGIHTILQKEFPQLKKGSYQDPTLTLPEKPPVSCELNEDVDVNCSNSHQLLSYWWSKFNETVDDILLRSNIHRCSFSDPEKNKFKAKGCLNKDGICKARFPRPFVPETAINVDDGYINLKKLEPLLNTISPCITYLFRCNTDVTSLLSGTSIKAVISYVTNYIAKPTLKTYQIFATAYNVFDKNANSNSDENSSRTDDARKIILNIVNALSSKMEIGSPMASMYLLKNPDHYTSHGFIPFFWKSFVNDVTKSEASSHEYGLDVNMEDEFQEKPNSVGLESQFDHSVFNKNEMAMDIDDPTNFLGGRGHIEDGIQFEDQDIDGDQDDEGAKDDDDDDDDDDNDEEDGPEEKLLISQDGSEFVASSKVDDYKYRPEAYSQSRLYDWAKLSVKIKIQHNKKDSTYHKFLPGHAQRNSHVVKLDSSREDIFVLNFIGGPLPRRDQGDFEYYCRTMLTLFKPWRSSCDLKEKHRTWSEAFASYNFKIIHKKIMNNFNLRYECLDERDDYHAILKRQSRLREQKASSLLPDQYDNDCDLGINSNFDEDYGDQDCLGSNAIKKAQQMIETELLLNKAGWLDTEKNIKVNVGVPEFHPSVNNSGSQWKNIVKQC